jgi:hypothetical protein
MESARKLPTIADLQALPRNIKGEIIEGVLYTMTRPRARHQLLATAMGGRLHEPFNAGRGGLQVESFAELRPHHALKREHETLQLSIEALQRLLTLD